MFICLEKYKSGRICTEFENHNADARVPPTASSAHLPRQISRLNINVFQQGEQPVVLAVHLLADRRVLYRQHGEEQEKKKNT